MKRKWAISDIHGCCKTLRKLVEDKIQLQQDDKLYLLGDYIDRGSDSKGVFDYIFKLKEAGYKVYTLRGNHEDILLRNLKDKSYRDGWFIHGGLETLKSFNVWEVEDIPKKYLRFIDELDFFIEKKKYILVHAGINTGIKDPFADKESMMWIRDAKFKPEKVNYKQVIHGHTPIKLKDIKKSLEKEDNYVINIDNGCVYNDRAGMGNLVALELGSKELIVQKNVDLG